MAWGHGAWHLEGCACRGVPAPADSTLPPAWLQACRPATRPCPPTACRLRRRCRRWAGRPAARTASSRWRALPVPHALQITHPAPFTPPACHFVFFCSSPAGNRQDLDAAPRGALPRGAGGKRAQPQRQASRRGEALTAARPSPFCGRGCQRLAWRVSIAALYIPSGIQCLHALPFACPLPLPLTLFSSCALHTGAQLPQGSCPSDCQL